MLLETRTQMPPTFQFDRAKHRLWSDKRTLRTSGNRRPSFYARSNSSSEHLNGVTHRLTGGSTVGLQDDVSLEGEAAPPVVPADGARDALSPAPQADKLGDGVGGQWSDSVCSWDFEVFEVEEDFLRYYTGLGTTSPRKPPSLPLGRSRSLELGVCSAESIYHGEPGEIPSVAQPQTPRQMATPSEGSIAAPLASTTVYGHIGAAEQQALLRGQPCQSQGRRPRAAMSPPLASTPTETQDYPSATSLA